jgi:LemA protein
LVASLLIIIVVILVIVTYNSFITLGERVINGKAQIATQIESRWDAIKNLIHATKSYSQHEAETLENITEMRARVGKSSNINELEQDDTQLNNVIGRLIAISENYPDLKASEVYKSTMESINNFENNVRNARMIYNDVVTRYNRKVKMFPSNIIAKTFSFTEKEYFNSTESKQEMPGWE